MELPVFHPCVRLSRWRERPGELSFIPPDGRFVLAGYEVDLLPFSNGKTGSLSANNLKLPVSVEIKTGLGISGLDFEVRLSISKTFAGQPGPSNIGDRGGGGGARRGGIGGPHSGTVAAPSLEDLEVIVPLPAEVRNLTDIRAGRGDATYNPGDSSLQWRIPTKDLAAGSAPYFVFRCTVVGSPTEDNEDENDPTGFGFASSGIDYTHDHEPYQSPIKSTAVKPIPTGVTNGPAGAGVPTSEVEDRRSTQSKMLMPSSASVSFSVRGWLPSGIKVESILLDVKKSRGLGESIKPYKGVKYLTVSKGGVEIRC